MSSLSLSVLVQIRDETLQMIIYISIICKCRLDCAERDYSEMGNRLSFLNHEYEMGGTCVSIEK